ncbi:MAG: BamA/TamA family outer membrane protein [Deltaproteobacteria bacterium]|nr:BamA/TamA family outer membrane protein [Deltaproteobacteria bacterium]
MLRSKSIIVFLMVILATNSLHAVAQKHKKPAKSRKHTVEEKNRKSRKQATEDKESQSLQGDAAAVNDNFGEKFVSGVDRIIRKKTFELFGDPWTIQGLPLIFQGASTGFHLGFRVAMQNIARLDPHKFELEAQVLASDRGRYKHSLKLDFPRLWGDKFRATGRFAYDRDINQRYFGIGNETVADREAVKNDAIEYQNTRTGPSFSLYFLRYLGESFRLGPGVSFKWTEIGAPNGSLLSSERPTGIAGGRTHSFGLIFIHDTLDFEPYPSRGNYHEVFLNFYSPVVGSDYNFFRGTYTFRKYWPLHRTLTFAHRTLFEVLTGDIPFYELGAVGGMDSTRGFGGDRFMRGFEGNRFIDQIKLALGFELRWDPVQFIVAKQEFTIGVVPFFDVGRVWNKLLPIQIGTLHASAGWGARVTWNRRFILRGDFAVTPEGTDFYIDLGQSF